jgi:hypothetical protein
MNTIVRLLRRTLFKPVKTDGGNSVPLCTRGRLKLLF